MLLRQCYLVLLAVFAVGMGIITGVESKKAAAPSPTPTNAPLSSSPLDFDYHIWDNVFKPTAAHGSYLAPTNTSAAHVATHNEEVSNLLKMIYTNQFPPKSKCASRRFLILDMSDASFEGIGSVLREAMFAMATAMHSNRTLIWGLHVPMLFRYSHELLLNEEVYENIKLDIDTGGDTSMLLNCRANNIGDYISGPYRCFFQPISSCSLDDVTYQEMVDYSNGRQFDDHSRLMRNDLRRSPSLYHPPFGLFEYMSKIPGNSFSGSMDDGNGFAPALGRNSIDKYHLWSAAVAAFIFRLKSDVVKSFIRRNSDIGFPFSQPLLDKYAPSPLTMENGLPREEMQKKTVWGIHIRHGDLKFNKQIYSYKRVFQFEEYFEGARAHSHKLGHTPDYLYVATDSDDIAGLLTAYNKFNKEIQGSDGGWYGGQKVPAIIVLDNDHRFRTPIGSHAVAAGGGCVLEPKLAREGLKRCTVLPEHVKQYMVNDVPRSEMMMRIMIDAIEDIFLLSLCDVFIGSGSSYYSSVAALLSWANNGDASDNFMNRVLFLEQEELDRGVIATAYLPLDHRVDASDNDLNSLLTSGTKKWEFETNSFITGLQNSGFQYESVGFNPWSSKYFMRMEHRLPRLPDRLFYLESKMWLAVVAYVPVLRGHCPPAFTPNKKNRHTSEEQIRQQVLEYVTAVVNLGVEHYSAEHPNMALICWFNSISAIHEFGSDSTTGAIDNKLKDGYEIAAGNAAAFRMPIYAQALQYYHNLMEYVNILLDRDVLEKKTGEYYEKNSHELSKLGFQASPGSRGPPQVQEQRHGYRAVQLNQQNTKDGVNLGFGAEEPPTVKPFDYFFRRHQKIEEDRHRYKGLDDVVEETAMLEYELSTLMEQKQFVDLYNLDFAMV
jgi:hypothetical protein